MDLVEENNVNGTFYCFKHKEILGPNPKPGHCCDIGLGDYGCVYRRLYEDKDKRKSPLPIRFRIYLDYLLEELDSKRTVESETDIIKESLEYEIGRAVRAGFNVRDIRVRFQNILASMERDLQARIINSIP